MKKGGVDPSTNEDEKARNDNPCSGAKTLVGKSDTRTSTNTQEALKKVDSSELYAENDDFMDDDDITTFSVSRVSLQMCLGERLSGIDAITTMFLF